MSQVLAQININAPADEVWKVLVDSGRLSEWLPYAANLGSLAQLAGGSPSPKHYHHDLFSAVDERASEWEAGRSYSYVVNNVGFIKRADSSFSLSPCEEGTLLTQSVDFQMKYGVVGAMMDRLVFRPQFRKQMGTSLRALKDFVEGPYCSDGRTEAGYPLAA